MAIAQKPGHENKRIRGSNLTVFVKDANGVPMEEALRKADEAGLVLASNKRLGKSLVGSEEFLGIIDAFTCWSGTMAAYDKPDQRLGKYIEYTDDETGTRYVFPVPEAYRGMKNVVLLSEHPGFALDTEGKTIVVQSREVGIVVNFPVETETWHLSDPKYDIPTGKEVDCEIPAARCLWRMEKRVGLVARGYLDDSDDYSRRDVYLVNPPSNALGAVVESPVGIGHCLLRSLAGGETGAFSTLNVREEGGRLIVEGMPEQISALARLLEQLK